MARFHRFLSDVAPGACQAIRGVQACVRGYGLDHALSLLVKVRASQINLWNRVARGGGFHLKAA
jgi:hypothetical protein